MGGYTVEVRPAVRRALRKMEPDTRAAILGVLANLRAAPRPLGVVALQGHRPYLRLRIGDYRVIYVVDDDAKVVTVAVAGHRSDVYRSLSTALFRPRR